MKAPKLKWHRYGAEKPICYMDVLLFCGDTINLSFLVSNKRFGIFWATMVDEDLERENPNDDDMWAYLNEMRGE
jgi:hypothetical protein